MKINERLLLIDNWRLVQAEKGIDIPAEVPGSVFEALIRNKVIDDPFYGEKEREVEWVYESDWMYECKFDLTDASLQFKTILLRFWGIDTVSEISLNDEIIGNTDNMFIWYEFNVKSKLKASNNVLRVKIKSPTKSAKEQVKKYKKRLITTQKGLGAPYLRKAQFSFGWDWGPVLPDIGVWKPVELIGFDDLRISTLRCDQTIEFKNQGDISKIEAESVLLRVKVQLESPLKDLSSLGYSIKTELIGPSDLNVSKEFSINNKEIQIEMEVPRPSLWWTNDLGEPVLYDLTISVIKEQAIDTTTINIGFRDLRIVRNADKWGETFYFVLNGVPLFAKGADWIPIDSFISRGKKMGLYRKNLEYAAEAHMNMLRAWGGGVYEDEEFYNICDELGILVWQDLPFACALYPIYQEFFENVKFELIQNIKRLQNHPSLAIWCGNNEIEQAWSSYILNAHLWRPKDTAAYEKGYLDLFKEIIPNSIKEYDPTRPYWPSSALDKWDGKKVRSTNPNNAESGDSHFWKVWHSGAPFKEYRKFDSRFMSEFGFESFPSMKTIALFCPPDQYRFDSPIMENHQKNSAGNDKIMRYMKRRFIVPESFEKQVILSQITQAEAIEYGVEHWRRNRNEFHCMGSLYWQINDCWPVASWSSLDYYLRWKALHYFAKRFYQALFPSVKEGTKSLELWLTNDCRTTKEGIFEWKILHAEGEAKIKGLKKVAIPPCSALMIEKIELASVNIEKSNLSQFIVFYSFQSDKVKDVVISRGFRLFDAPKRFPIKDPILSFQIGKGVREKSGNLNYSLTIKAKKIALYVFIDSEKVDFISSDNFFSMEPEETRIISIRIVNSSSYDESTIDKLLLDSITIKSLYNLL